MILLPLPPKCWDCKRVSPHPAYLNDGMKPRASRVLGRHHNSRATAENNSLQLTCGKGSTLNPAMPGWKSPTWETHLSPVKPQMGLHHSQLLECAVHIVLKCPAAVAVSESSLPKASFIFVWPKRNLLFSPVIVRMWLAPLTFGPTYL